MPQLLIAPVLVSELASLAALGRQTFTEAFAHQNKPEDFQQYLREAFSPKTIHDTWLNPDTEYYFARLDDHIIGYLKLNVGAAQTEPMGPDAMEVERIYVRQSEQGKGCGQALLNWAVQRAKLKMKSRLWLGVWEENPRAITFYERFGFRAFGTHIYTLGQDDQTDVLLDFTIR